MTDLRSAHRMRIFFTDLDGTLLNSRKKVTPATRAALEAFTNAGGHFVISTGRALDSAQMVQKELDLFFPGTFLVGYNGAEIYDCDERKVIRREPLGLDQVKIIFDLAAACDVHVHTYEDNKILSSRNGECMDYYRRVIKSPLCLVKDVPAEIRIPPCKCISVELHDHEKQERYRLALKEALGDSIVTLYSNPYYLEIFSPHAGKGSAVTWLCDYLKIPVERSMAAGDEENDISMIKAAGLGIAMCNGTDAVKAAADYITPRDNDHDGLADILLRQAQQS